MEGWFKFERKWLENSVLTEDTDYLNVWIHLVAGAAFEPRDVIFRGKPVTLQPGQLITGRRKLAKEVHVQEDKVQRILKRFEQAGYLAQETSSKCRRITLFFDRVDAQEMHSRCTASEQAQTQTGRGETGIAANENAQQMHSTCTTDTQQMHSTYTTDAQQMHTYKELKNEKNERAKNLRAGARETKRGKDSVFSADASYDLQAFMKNAIGLRDIDFERDKTDPPDDADIPVLS